MDLTGIETRVDSTGRTVYRAYAKTSGQKVRSQWGTYAYAVRWRAVHALGGAEPPRARRRGEKIPRAVSGFIYFVQAGAYGPIKIGWSASHPTVRLATLQSANHEELRLLSYRAGTQRDERDLHRLLANCRIRGEWFLLDPCTLERVLGGQNGSHENEPRNQPCKSSTSVASAEAS